MDMEPGNHGPAVERALLTAELRRLRLASGERQQDVAKACEWSVSKFTRIESGTTPVTKTDLEALLRHYGVTDNARISELTARARAARSKGWWEEYAIGDKAFEAYVGYEDGASVIRMSQNQFLPGLLQTPKYTRVIMEAFRIPDDDIAQTIRLRQERQRRVGDRAPEQVYILDESAIARPTPKNVMSEQLGHLVNLAGKPAVSIRVIPFNHGPHFGLRGPFVLLGFDVSLEDVLYLESGRRGDLLIAEAKEQVAGPGVPTVADPDDAVAEYVDGFDSLLEVALSADESVKLIERIARDVG